MEFNRTDLWTSSSPESLALDGKIAFCPNSDGRMPLKAAEARRKHNVPNGGFGTERFDEASSREPEPVTDLFLGHRPPHYIHFAGIL